MVAKTRRIKGGWVDPKTLPQGPNGKALCRWCGVEVAGRRRTFCSDACVHEFKLRSNPSYVRRKLEERDHCICAICGIDCFALRRRFQRMRKALRAPKLEQMIREGWPKTILQIRRSWWEADHLLPVAKGGGECGLENYRTLCLRCHRNETGSLIQELVSSRRDSLDTQAVS